MRILYLQTVPEPEIAGTDALFQEIAALRRHYGGDSISLFPLAKPARLVPKSLYGIRQLKDIERINRDYDLVHIYHSQLEVFPFLRRLKVPIVYTVVAGTGSQSRLPSPAEMRGIKAVAVSNERDAVRVRERGIGNLYVIPPGIDTTGFTVTAPPSVDNGFRLLMGSAPWTRGQFKTKGVKAVIEAAAHLPWLHLVFLWRGRNQGLLEKKIKAAGIEDRSEIINRRVEVAGLLRDVHAAAVFAASAKLVKAWPHSLLEALACGRPAVASSAIPMADFVQEHNCGTVADGVSAGQIAAALESLRENYSALAAAVAALDMTRFSAKRLVEDYGRVYSEVLGRTAIQ